MATTFTRPRDGKAHAGGLRDYIQLTKPRIVTLLVFTTVTAMVVAAQGRALPPVALLATILGGGLAAAGSSVINQWYDRDMAWSAFVLAAAVNWLAAGLSMFGAAYYVIGYTMLLKRNTVLNILIGGGAGAMPVLVGWAAATGRVDPAALILFAIVFYWTPPHSWALALLVNEDYARAHVPMMPVARGLQAARVQILLYSIQLVAVTLIPVPFRVLGVFYLLSALLLGAGMILEAVRLLREKTPQAARRTYKYSTFYLALLFLAMIIDQILSRMIAP
jgi:protoheme IX farnesyltransferase